MHDNKYRSETNFSTALVANEGKRGVTHFDLIPKFYKSLIVAVFIIYNGLTTCAQTLQKIEGQIIDSISMEGLPNASIEISDDYLNGFNSDSIGFFKLYTTNDKVKIKISYLGYKTRIKTIFKGKFNAIKLQKESINLPEVVFENKIDSSVTYCCEDKYIIDYEIYKNKLFILYALNNLKFLDILYINSLVSDFRIKLPLNEIYLELPPDSCLFLLRTDSVYPISLLNDTLIFVDKGASKVIYDNFYPNLKLVFPNKNYYYLNFLNSYGLSIVHYDLLNGTSKTIFTYSNRKKLNISKSFESEILAKKYYLDNKGLFDMGDIWISENSEINELKDLSWFYNETVSKKIKCFLFNKNDSIVLFNFENDSIYTFYNDILIYKVPIKFRLNGLKDEFIIKDYISNRLFYIALESNKILVNEIFNTSNSLFRTIITKGYGQLDDFKIYGNRLFLISDSNIDNKRRLIVFDIY